MNRRHLVRVALAALWSLSVQVPVTFAQSQTAQSIMVKMDYDSVAYEIDGTITWSFDRGTAGSPGCAMNAYTNAWDGNAPVVTVGSGADPGAVTAPAPEGNRLQNHAQGERCTFFCGGTLTSDSYVQTVNQVRGWKRTFTYNITPVLTTVAPRTCWNSEVTGSGSVDATFEGFVCSESFLKQSARSKYSFTAVDSDGASRILNVQAELQKQLDDQSWTTVAGPFLVPQADVTTGLLPVTAATADFNYFGNAGGFGKAAALPSLHYAGGKAGNSVSNILNGISDGSNSDDFAGNNNDLANGNVHMATFGGQWQAISEPGTYRTVITGTLKGNSGTAAADFSVASELVVIGGCNCGS